MVANTQFTHNFTHRVVFGVLDLLGFYGLLRVSFLNQFFLYSIEVASPTDKVVLFTLPKTKEVIQLCGVSRQRYILGIPCQYEHSVGSAVVRGFSVGCDISASSVGSSLAQGLYCS